MRLELTPEVNDKKCVVKLGKNPAKIRSRQEIKAVIKLIYYTHLTATERHHKNLITPLHFNGETGNYRRISIDIAKSNYNKILFPQINL